MNFHYVSQHRPDPEATSHVKVKPSSPDLDRQSRLIHQAFRSLSTIFSAAFRRSSLFFFECIPPDLKLGQKTSQKRPPTPPETPRLNPSTAQSRPTDAASALTISLAVATVTVLLLGPHFLRRTRVNAVRRACSIWLHRA